MASRQDAAPNPTYQQGGDPHANGKKGTPVTATLIKQRWDDSQKASAKERAQYWLNSSCLAGEQYVNWDVHNNRLVDIPPDGDRLQLVENRLWPSVRTLVAKLLKRPLVFEVPPTSADDASQDGARVAGAVLADVHHRHDWEGMRHTNAMLTFKGGLSVLCVEWDPQAGTPLGVTETGDNFGVGDTCESVLSVLEVATEPGCRNLETARWWIKAAALPPCEVKERYKLDREPPADATGGYSPLQRKLIAGGGGSTEANLTLVLTYFERPSRDNPQGAVAVVVDGKLVEGPKAWPFPFKDRLNAVVVRETPHDQDWLADTILSAAISPQFALNHAISKIGDHLRLAADAKLMVNESEEEWDLISDVPEVVHVPFNNGGKSAEWLGAPAMPAWWETAPERFKKAIDDILGVHDISRGDAPPGVDAGIALSLLAEQDDTPLGLLSKEMAEAWGRLGSLVLAIYEENVTETREAKVARIGQAPETVTWSGDDLHGQTTAVVPLNAVAPRSDAAQMELAFRVKGTFPEIDLKTWAKIANLPDAADLTEAVDPDVAKARWENGQMEEGEVLIPADFDDHAKHVHEHNVFRKSRRYDALDDETRAIIDAHVAGHAVDGAREMGDQLARAQVSPALAAAPQANEPPMAGMPDAGAMMGQAQADGFNSGGAMEGADGQATAAPDQGQ